MNFEDFKSKIASDKDFAAKFVGKKPSEVVALAKAEGYNISTADLKMSLSDDDFDAVAGGAFLSGLSGGFKHPISVVSGSAIAILKKYN